MLLLIWLSLFSATSSGILELDESFVTDSQKGSWVVNFYAPWCSYCRRLAPVYEAFEVSLSGMLPSVRVARVDASTFNSIGHKFGVKGFPTIKYFENGKIYTYDGERSVRGLLSFVLRMHGPAVKTPHSKQELSANITFFESDPFFVLLERADSRFTDVFFDAAERLRMLSWFLMVHSDLLSMHLPTPAAANTDIMVFKDNQTFIYPYDPDLGHLSKWILQERYPIFPHFSSYGIWDFGSSEQAVLSQLREVGPTIVHRSLALFVVDPSTVTDDSSVKFIEFGRSLAQKRQNPAYQFGWTDAVASLADTAMADLITPTFVVYDPVKQLVYLYPHHIEVSDMGHSEQESIYDFLSSVQQSKIKPYGGKGFFTKLRRLLRKLLAEFMHFASHHPMIALLICAVPTMVISGMFYLCFCLDDQYPGEYGHLSDADAVRIARNERDSTTTLSRRSTKHYTVTGPVNSKDVIDAKHLDYEKWKKTQ